MFISPMRSPLAATCVALSLAACQRSDLPPGTSFISDSRPAVVLNLQGDTWRIYVDGIDRTEAMGLAVNPADDKDPHVYVQVRVLRPDVVVPGAFSLQYDLAGGYRCSGSCPGGGTKWRLNKS
jgi:hypothetical protein